jgi:DNA-binding transcriptional LysR family regulator
MDLKKLESFRAIAKYGSLGTAAARQRLTVPALSIQLKKLEAELGVILFDRQPRKLVLTDRGRLFLKQVDEAFNVLQRAKHSILDPTNDFVGSLSVCMASDIARFFAPGIANFVKKYPKLNATILVRTSREALSMVVDGEIDIGVGFVGRPPRGLDKTKILQSDVGLVVPKGHPLLREKRPSLADVAQFRIVMPRRGSSSRTMIENAFAGEGIDTSNVVEVGRCQATMDFVGLGLGVGFIHSVCAAIEPNKKLTVINMSHRFDKSDVALVTRSNAGLGVAQKAFMETFIASANKLDLRP